MVGSELNYHTSQNHIYLNRNIFCLNCHGLLVLLVRVISSLCIETHKVESAKEIKRSAKEIWDRNGMKESHEIVQVSPSRSVFPLFVHLNIFLSQTIRLFILISQGYPPNNRRFWSKKEPIEFSKQYLKTINNHDLCSRTFHIIDWSTLWPSHRLSNSGQNFDHLVR